VLPLFSCRVRAGTACRGLGPYTAHASCRAGTDTTSIVSCRVFLVSCVVPPVVSGPFGHLYPLPKAESTKSAPLHGLVLRRQHHGWIPREACARVISPPISEQLQPGEREDGSPALAPAPAPPRRLKVHRREAPLRPCADAMLQLR
jgi:hypothetical protein